MCSSLSFRTVDPQPLTSNRSIPATCHSSERGGWGFLPDRPPSASDALVQSVAATVFNTVGRPVTIGLGKILPEQIAKVLSDGITIINNLKKSPASSLVSLNHDKAVFLAKQVQIYIKYKCEFAENVCTRAGVVAFKKITLSRILSRCREFCSSKI